MVILLIIAANIGILVHSKVSAEQEVWERVEGEEVREVREGGSCTFDKRKTRISVILAVNGIGLLALFLLLTLLPYTKERRELSLSTEDKQVFDRASKLIRDRKYLCDMTQRRIRCCLKGFYNFCTTQNLEGYALRQAVREEMVKASGMAEMLTAMTDLFKEDLIIMDNAGRGRGGGTRVLPMTKPPATTTPIPETTVSYKSNYTFFIGMAVET